jgi:Leucine-rich repeat (LRR) protein
MPGFDAGAHDDPFNQLPKGGASVIRRRADSARTDGRLNIAALALKEIPEEVLKMYDYEYNKDSSDVAWGEAVDLTKFIAADNELEKIPDEIFPDTSVDAPDDDDTPVLFGGLELLDLHGNHLTTLPVGIRRLERLTVLNLVSAVSNSWRG